MYVPRKERQGSGTAEAAGEAGMGDRHYHRDSCIDSRVLRLACPLLQPAIRPASGEVRND